MSLSEEAYGANASIRIQFDGSLDQLAGKIGKALMVEFEIQTDMEPPHAEFASAEAMGLEAWLRREEVEGPSCYLMTLTTEGSLGEEFNGRMHDLSKWLARYVATLCDVQATQAAPVKP
jgi:hypothetical protein